LLGGFVVGLGEVDAVDGDEEEVGAFEDVEGGGVAGAGDEEGVAAEAGNGDETAGGEHGVAEGFVLDAGLFEGEVDAGFALAVGPGAVGGAVGGGAGFAVEDGREEDGLDLVEREECAGRGGGGVRGDGGEEEGGGGEESGRALAHGWLDAGWSEDPPPLPPGTFGAKVLRHGGMGSDLWKSAFTASRVAMGCQGFPGFGSDLGATSIVASWRG
jgi:hypothetical protein